MRVYETADAFAAVLPHTDWDSDRAKRILSAVAPHVANAALYDLERQFIAAAQQAGMAPGVVDTFAQVIRNYRKSATDGVIPGEVTDG